MSRRNGQHSQKPKQSQDLGAGCLVATYDHATQSARVVHDNLSPELILALCEMAEKAAYEMLRQQERERAREEVLQELKESAAPEQEKA